MISWFKYPFIRLLIPLMLGILMAFITDEMYLSEKRVIIMLIFLYILFFFMILVSVVIKGLRYRWVFAVLLCSFFMMLGFYMVKIREYKLKINDISIYNVPDFYVARLIEYPSVKDKSIKVMLDLIAVQDSTSNFFSVDSKVVAYFEKTDKAIDLEYGDYICIFDLPEEVKPPPNPEQFDYKDYLYKKGVTHQVYLKSDAWLSMNYNKANPIYKFSYYIRDFLLYTMSSLGIQGEEYAVSAAILLGYDESLPYDLRHKYVAAGAMHILCVSGLHVGVIFMVFSYMLIFLDDRKSLQRIIKQFFLLVLIWFYALLAGLAPSILRATIMLSFVIIGNIINRKGFLLNSLAASAFILLCIEPANLFDIGFLLSYVAVVGIVVMQNPIKRIVDSKYMLVNKIWEVTSVTVAAQIATAPFTIYYFHQFPIYFWLSNLFMTPISSIVIIGGMIMLLLSFIPYLNCIIAWFVSKMIFVMNFGVSWIESLPYSIVKGLYIDKLQFIVLLLLLLSLLLWVELRAKRMVFLIMLMVSFFLLLNIENLSKQRNQREMIIYSVNNMTVIDFINGRSHLLLTDTAFINDERAFSYNIENFLVSKGVFHNGESRLLDEDFNHNFVQKRKNVVTFDGKLIGLSDGGETFDAELSYRFPLDYLIVYGRGRHDLLSLLKVYKFDNLIIASSVPYYAASRLVEKAGELGIKCHNIREEGALSIE